MMTTAVIGVFAMIFVKSTRRIQQRRNLSGINMARPFNPVRLSDVSVKDPKIIIKQTDRYERDLVH